MLGLGGPGEAGGGACGWGAPVMGGTGALQAWPSLPFQRLLGLRHDHPPGGDCLPALPPAR